MTDYIVFGSDASFDEPKSRHPLPRIKGICVEGPDHKRQRIDADQVAALIENGDRFVVKIDNEPDVLVHAVKLSYGRYHLATDPDATKANNLVRLPPCPM
jgi:uncharacterized protein DUF3892